MSLVMLKVLSLTTMPKEKKFCNALEGTTHRLRTTNLIFNMVTYQLTYAKIEVHVAYTQCTHSPHIKMQTDYYKILYACPCSNI
jgi:hypothetical protein